MFGKQSEALLSALIAEVKALNQTLAASRAAPDGDGICPVMKCKCIEYRCRWYTKLLGKHPQTSIDMEQWDCAIPHHLIAQIGTSNEVRQGAAATESLRNTTTNTLHGIGALLAGRVKMLMHQEQSNRGRDALPPSA